MTLLLSVAGAFVIFEHLGVAISVAISVVPTMTLWRTNVLDGISGVVVTRGGRVGGGRVGGGGRVSGLSLHPAP